MNGRLAKGRAVARGRRIFIGVLAIALLAMEIPIAEAATCGAGDGLRPCAGHGVLNAVAPPVVHRHSHWPGAGPGGDSKAAQVAHPSGEAGDPGGATASDAHGAAGAHAGHGGHYH